MKRVALALLGLAALAAPSFAADMPVRRDMRAAPVKAPMMLATNWSGWHAGLNFGGGFSDVEGIVFGGQLGYNWQVNQLVFGVETDIQWSDQDRSSILLVSPAAPIALTNNEELEWFGTTRLRVGYAWDRWLPYFTVGLAYGERRFSGTAASAAAGVPLGAYNVSHTGIGWAIGFGVDYMINPAWSARLEYLHINIDGDTRVLGTVATAPVLVTGDLDNDIVRGAINYRFLPY
jgi:outer membrane immunogenic protein